MDTRTGGIGQPASNDPIGSADANRRPRRRWLHGLKEAFSDLPVAARREAAYAAGLLTEAILIITWRCTSRCVSCSAWRRPARPEDELSDAQWLQVVRRLLDKGVRKFELFGGDVFLRPELVINLCRAIHAAGGQTYVPTNSLSLDDATAIRLANCAHTLYLSTDAPGEANDRIRGVAGAHERVRQALQALRQARGDRSRPRLVCNTTVSRHNASMLEQIADCACELGFDEVHFEYVGELTASHAAASAIAGQPPDPIYLRRGQSSLLTADQVEQVRRQVRQARTKARMLDRPFRVVSANLDALSDAALVGGMVPPRRCFMERCTAVIDPVGNIVPCVFFDNFAMGNVRNGGLDQPWLTPRRRQFRTCRALDKLALCQHCIMSVERNRTGWDVLARAFARGAES